MITYGKIGDAFIVRNEGNQYIVEELVGAGLTYLPKVKFNNNDDAISWVIREIGREQIQKRFKAERGLK